MRHRTVRGQIRYTSKKPEIMDQERGREWFTFTHHDDGSVLLRAHCEIEEPEPTVLRDIILSVGPDKKARHCHVHLIVGDKPMGSGWFNLEHGEDDGVVECESWSPAMGRLSQRVPYTGAFDGFGTHPLVGDGFLMRSIDASRGAHRRGIRVFVPSPDHRGATAPMVSEVKMDVEYVGDEEITVKAGTFACRHYRFIDDAGPGMGGIQHPPYDLWTTADDDCVFVQGGVGGYMATWYELVALER